MYAVYFIGVSAALGVRNFKAMDHQNDTDEGNAVNLVDVNDHCLYEIFRYLPVRDLNSYASSCTRFNYIARDVFKFNHKEMEVDPWELSTEWSVTECRRFLVNFGHLIENLFISKFFSCTELNNILSILSNTSSGGNLKELYLDHDHFVQDVAYDEFIKWREIFRHLTVIRTYYLGSIMDLLSVSKECRDLAINLDDTNGRYLSLTFPHLERFYLNRYKEKNGDLSAFLKRHPELKVLQLVFVTMNLVENSPIFELSKLETLMMFYSKNEMPLRILQNTKSVESLQRLDYCVPNHFCIPAINRFQNLKVLKLSFAPNARASTLHLGNEFLLQLNLENLEKFRFRRSTGVAMDGIIEFVRRHPKLTKIKLSHTEAIKINRRGYNELVKICYSQRKKLFIYLTNLRSCTGGVRINKFIDYVEMKEFKFFYKLESRPSIIEHGNGPKRKCNR